MKYFEIFHNCFSTYVKWYFGLFWSVDRVHPNDIFNQLCFFILFLFFPISPSKGKRRTKIKRVFFLLPPFSFYLQFFSSILFVLPFFRNDKKKETWKLSTPIFFHTHIRERIWRGKLRRLFFLIFVSISLSRFFSRSLFPSFKNRKRKGEGERRRENNKKI